MIASLAPWEKLIVAISAGGKLAFPPNSLAAGVVGAFVVPRGLRGKGGPVVGRTVAGVGDFVSVDTFPRVAAGGCATVVSTTSGGGRGDTIAPPVIPALPRSLGPSAVDEKSIVLPVLSYLPS